VKNTFSFIVDVSGGLGSLHGVMKAGKQQSWRRGVRGGRPQRRHDDARTAPVAVLRGQRRHLSLSSL